MKFAILFTDFNILHNIQHINSIVLKLNEILNIDIPIILAPMFLVSNADMVKAALDAGITAAIPALNYKTNSELRTAIQEIKQHSNKPFGINLIVNKSNIYLKNQLQACLDLEVDYIITALGSPRKIIDQCKKKNIKVFCDVLNSYQAKKVENLGADAVIALNNSAGGHLGIHNAKDFIPELLSEVKIPIISAGGVANYKQYKEVMNLGAAGCSVGSIFIASTEAPVSLEYKNAIVHYGAKDIVITKKISGSPCTVINTPFVQKIGTKETVFEKIMNRNKRLKKYLRFILATRGMNKLRNAAFKASYKSIWCAGTSIEEVNEIRPISKIVKQLTSDH